MHVSVEKIRRRRREREREREREGRRRIKSEPKHGPTHGPPCMNVLYPYDCVEPGQKREKGRGERERASTGV